MASWKFVHAVLLGLVAVAALHSIFLFRYYYEFCFGSSCNRSDNRNYYKSNFSIIIIGAGPTALGAAHRLHELRKEFPNISVAILEQGEKPGGLASSERDNEGFLWNVGGHVVFSHYYYFDETINRVVKDWNQIKRAAYVFMTGSDNKRRFIPYPVQNNVEMMDKVDQQKSLSGLQEIATSNPRKKKLANFDKWLLGNFGTGLFEVFMRKYNRKFWTVDPSEMNYAWVNERDVLPDIAKIKLKTAALGSGTSVNELTPDDNFRFPRHKGTGGMWEAVADNLPRGWFKFCHKVTDINMDTKSVVVELRDAKTKAVQELKFDSLISTAPLDILVGNIIKGRDLSRENMKKLTSQLVYSRVHVIGIGLKGQPPKFLSNKSWIYFPDSDSPFYRITVFSSYSEDHVLVPGKQWSLMCEVAEPKVNSSPEKWTKERLIDATIQALITYGFITSEMVLSKYYRRLDHGYPVPSIKREIILEKVQPWLESKDIYSRGRFGGWRYEVANQDHSFMQGVEIIDKLLRGIPEETYFNASLVNLRKNTGRFYYERLLDYEIVISHYNEKLDWVAPLANHSHVYHKGKDLQPPPLRLYAWEKLPNVGRESHTYLHHIINNYEKLPEITVFIQGEGVSRHCFENFDEILAKIKQNITCKVFYRSTENGWTRIKHNSKFLVAFNNGEMRHANLTLGEFFQELFGFPHPRDFPQCWSACLAATRHMIKKHPIDFYKKAISFVDDHPNPEEGHYFERLWPIIFS